MSGKNLWHEDGTPRRPLPTCPFCGDNKMKSNLDQALCQNCGWCGTLTKLLELDVRRRPGARLLEFLETRGVPLGRFACDIGLGKSYPAALANIRQYTHPARSADADGRDKRGRPAIKAPTEKMLVRWAAYLDVDVGSFYRNAKE